MVREELKDRAEACLKVCAEGCQIRGRACTKEGTVTRCHCIYKM